MNCFSIQYYFFSFKRQTKLTHMNFRLFHYYRALVCFCVFFSPFFSGCDSKGSKEESGFVPRFVVKDSLVVDYLGQLSLVDFKKDRSEYLLYDGQRELFIRADAEGQIVQTKNLGEDGKDQFGSSFFSVNYLENGQLLFVGFNHFFWYDEELNLIEKKEIPFIIKSVYVSPGHANLLQGDLLFTHAVGLDVSDEARQSETFLETYPFLTVYDMAEGKTISQDFIPNTVQMIRESGRYMDSAPFSLIRHDGLYLLFPNSPEIYRFSFPDLSMWDVIELNPDKGQYSQIKPVPVKNYQNLSSYDMVTENSAYFGVFSSNDYLVAGYYGALPGDVFEAYKSTASSQERKEVLDKYKVPYYQVVRDGKKLWEGQINTLFLNRRGMLCADRNVNLSHEEKELDYVAFYFYEIE